MDATSYQAMKQQKAAMDAQLQQLGVQWDNNEEEMDPDLKELMAAENKGEDSDDLEAILNEAARGDEEALRNKWDALKAKSASLKEEAKKCKDQGNMAGAMNCLKEMKGFENEAMMLEQENAGVKFGK